MSHPDPLYDDYNDFYQEDLELNDHEDDFDNFDDYYEDTMDGDHDSAMTSCGWGTDEDYGYYGDDREDFHSDDGYGCYDDGE
jgi:hypothetical protein